MIPDLQLFRDVFDACPVGIAVENLEGQPLYVNRAFCSMLGFSEEELRSKHCVDFSPPEDAEKDWALFQQLRAGSIDRYQMEKRYFRRDGSVLWGRLIISLLSIRPSPLVLAMVEDITDKKLAEEDRFRHAAIVESYQDAIISKDLAAVITSWNIGAERIFGYKEEEVIGSPITILIPPDLWEEENQILERLRSGERVEHYETKRVTKTGKLVDVSLVIVPVKDSTGKVVAFTKIAHDITRRKQAEKALSESETRFRSLADTAPALIWMSGTDKLCTYFNKTWLDFTGRPLAEELGNGWAGGVHPDDFEGCLNTYTQSFDRREKFSMQYRLRRQDGEFRWVFDVGVPRFNEDHSFAGYIGIAVDVTDHIRGEQRLHEMNRALKEHTALLQSREELMKIFVKNVPAGVAMLDRDMRYLQVSDRWCADYSANSSQILGRSHYEVFPDIPERWKAVHCRALDGETLRADEDRWDREGRSTWVRWEVRPWKTPDGMIGGILIFAEDITRRKQMEDALSSMSRKLIESQEQERARIGRELHDDINQRLAMLAVELEQLQADPSEVQTRLQKLQKQTTELSSDVQALSHELHSSKLEYLGVISGMKSWCGEFGERQKMEIDFKSDVSTKLPFDVGICLFRVLQESLHNAAKHSGVKHIDVQLQEAPNEIHLTVNDLGRGFDVDTALQGQGLGLTSMRERVRLFNGSIAIQSKPMGGTTIHVRIPLASAHRAQCAAG